MCEKTTKCNCQESNSVTAIVYIPRAAQPCVPVSSVEAAEELAKEIARKSGLKCYIYTLDSVVELPVTITSLRKTGETSQQ